MQTWLPGWPPWRFWFGVVLKLLALAVVATFSPPETVTMSDYVAVGVYVLGTVYFLVGYIQWQQTISRYPAP